MTSETDIIYGDQLFPCTNCYYVSQVRVKVDETKAQLATFGAQDHCSIQCFVGIFLLVNLFSGEHVDLNDIPDGWTAMVPLGNYEGGELYLPDIGVRLPYRPRDVVFFRSRLLRHFTDYFNGVPRYVLVFTNNQGVFNFLSEKYDSLII